MIFDTNALSAVADGETGAVTEFGLATRIAVPVVVIAEYRYGIARSRHRREYERWLDDLLRVCSVLGVDEVTATHYAGLRSELKRAGTPIPSNDVWIAALCRQHALPIVSRDQHFDLVRGLKRIAW